MQPLGRIKVNIPGCKWHPKVNGKNVEGWWEHISMTSKKTARAKAKKEIERELIN